ncbi:hypothetical protein [Paenibacillus hexagrammi]|uniref:Uncharacterized protein n=1 Tax=Paenibacillus hexagrammi TaxID=2908839 RepID=A0ABY3SN98_9BACL|nr:hypothetical protein [Paenibacillus sp. YPD9-1]UJF35297.1 hypothetical protein L0M14_09420 [Paenibacillus sp. YPD9-1]
MQEPNAFEQLRNKYLDEDRAKLIMLQLRTLMEQKKKRDGFSFPIPSLKPHRKAGITIKNK